MRWRFAQHGRKKAGGFYSCAPMPGRVLIGNQWVAEIDGDIVPVGEHSSPEAALLAARVTWRAMMMMSLL